MSASSVRPSSLALSPRPLAYVSTAQEAMAEFLLWAEYVKFLSLLQQPLVRHARVLGETCSLSDRLPLRVASMMSIFSIQKNKFPDLNFDFQTLELNEKLPENFYLGQENLSLGDSLNLDDSSLSDLFERLRSLPFSNVVIEKVLNPEAAFDDFLGGAEEPFFFFPAPYSSPRPAIVFLTTAPGVYAGGRIEVLGDDDECNSVAALASDSDSDSDSGLSLD